MRFLLPSLAALTLLSGCATAVRGNMERLSVVTVPEGASVVTNLKDRNGKQLACSPTPCFIPVSRRASPRVTVSLEGYQPITYQVVSSPMTSNIATPEGVLIAGLPEKTSYVIAGRPNAANALATGGASLASGLITLGAAPLLDAGTGATLSLSPNPVTVHLRPIKPGEAE
ncbi:MAG: hypothetical protein AAF830_06775 [Pseudomonadota bacterium]